MSLSCDRMLFPCVLFCFVSNQKRQICDELICKSRAFSTWIWIMVRWNEFDCLPFLGRAEPNRIECRVLELLFGCVGRVYLVSLSRMGCRICGYYTRRSFFVLDTFIDFPDVFLGRFGSGKNVETDPSFPTLVLYLSLPRCFPIAKAEYVENTVDGIKYCIRGNIFIYISRFRTE